MNLTPCKPLLKWPGGKWSELPLITPRIPDHQRYLEPFFGGGSVFFGAISTDTCFANDAHQDLMGFYEMVKESHKGFFSKLYDWVGIWEESPISDKEEMYYSARDRYNSNPKLNIDRAMDFFLLRQLSYGGMFRVNSNGKFNVPFGRAYGLNEGTLRKKVDHLLSDEVAQKMEKIRLHSLDFQEFFDHVGDGAYDFVFVDPPYDCAFSKYGSRDFDSTDQKRLADCLHSFKGKFMLVTKITPLIENLYLDSGKFHVLPYDFKYKFNIKGRFPRDSKHAIITNYDPN